MILFLFFIWQDEENWHSLWWEHRSNCQHRQRTSVK